jgi:hypothetical protein
MLKYDRIRAIISEIGLSLDPVVFMFWYHDKIKEWEGKRENNNKFYYLDVIDYND